MVDEGQKIQQRYWMTGSKSNMSLAALTSINMGEQHVYWPILEEYTDAELHNAVEQGFILWCKHDSSLNRNIEWLWAAKMLVWRNPLDVEWMEITREQLGPLWLLYVRQSDEDWAWLYHTKNSMSVLYLEYIVAELPAHPIGAALAVTLIPNTGDIEELKSVRSTELARTNTFMAILLSYGEYLLHPDAVYYSQYRIMMICWYNLLKNKAITNKVAVETIRDVLTQARQWIGIKSNRSLYKGFSADVVEHMQHKNITNIYAWYTEVKKMGQKTWREQLVSH